MTVPPHELITYRTTGDLPRDGVLVLYGACRWSSAEKPDQLMAALAGSDAVVSAWHGDRLAGRGNAITDGALVAYYPHLLVHPDYQRRGIGREIMRQLMERHQGFHQQAILTDNDAVGFYRGCGFTQPAKVCAMWVYSAADHGPTGHWASQAEQFFWRALRENKRPIRQNVTLGLWAAQLIAILVAALASIEPESVLITGLILAIVGYGLAAAAWPLRSTQVITFALSAPLLTSLGAILLALLHVHVRLATIGIGMAVLLFGYAGLYAACRARPVLRQILSWQISAPTGTRMAWRFSLKSLLIAMTALAVSFAIIGSTSRLTNGNPVSIALATFAVANFALCGIVVVRFLQARPAG